MAMALSGVSSSLMVNPPLNHYQQTRIMLLQVSSSLIIQNDSNINSQQQLLLRNGNNKSFRNRTTFLGQRNATFFHQPVKENSHICANYRLNFPVISPDDHWGTWTALFVTAAFGIWSERTQIGSMVSAALVSTLVGLAASNLGIIPHEAIVYSIVFKYLLPLTIPLLLFRANLRHVVESTGPMFLAFCLGSVATMVGTLVAFLVVPMRSLGQDNWKIAASLMGSYIGGTINYVAISEALGVSPSVLAAGVAADNVVCALYFMVLFALASKIPSEDLKSTIDASRTMVSVSEDKFHVLQIAAALATSMAICKFAISFVTYFGIHGADLAIAEIKWCKLLSS